MKRYIDANKLIAEIERRKEEVEWSIRIGDKKIQKSGGNRLSELGKIKTLIDTLQQEQPGVELEEEIKKHLKACLDVKFPTTDIELIKKDVAYTARKFYELGLKCKK